MKVYWSFYLFNYEHYLEILPILRKAESGEDLRPLCLERANEFIEEDIENQFLSISEARAEILVTQCCIGEPLALDRSFVRFASAHAEEDNDAGIQLLGELLSGGKNMDPCLLPASRLMGFLTPDETLVLYTTCVPTANPNRRSGRRKKRRRIGGVVGACIRFVRLLLDREPHGEELFALLLELLAEAVRRGDGIAVLKA